MKAFWKFWYLSFIVALPLIVNPFGSFPYEIPKQVFLILGIAFAVLYFVFSFRGMVRFTFNKSVFMFAGFWLLSLVLSTIFSVAPGESFWGSTERMQGLFTWILYLLHFFICLQILGEESWRRVFFNLVAGVGFILSVYAILQHFGADLLDISDINEASGRSFATIGQPNFLGQYLIFPFFIVFVKIFEEKGWKRKGVFISLLSFIVFGLWTTLNRASLLGIIVSLVLFFFRKFRKFFSIGRIMASVAVVFAVVFLLISIGESRSVNSRMTLVKPIIPLIQEHWLIGAGPETMYQTYQKVLSKDIYLTEDLYDIPDRIHNESLQILLDQGVLGLIPYLLLIVFLTREFCRRESFSMERSAAFFAIIAYFISVQFSFSIAVHITNLLAMLAIFLLTSLTFHEISVEMKSLLSRWIIKSGALLMCVFYTYNGLAMLMADVHFEKAVSSYFSDDLGSISSFDLAIKLNPHARYYLYSAANLLSAKEPNIAMDNGYLDKLGALTNYGYHYNLAVANYYSAIKDLAGMENSYEKAAQQAPNWPLVWQQWGMKEFEEGRYEKAIEKYEKLVELAPPYWKWFINLEDRSFADREKQRLSKKNNYLFYMALHQLAAAYEKTRQAVRAEEIERYIK